jgi:hypothetical protein
MACRFTELIIDCHDPASLAEFWAQVLGYTVSETSAEGPAGVWSEAAAAARTRHQDRQEPPPHRRQRDRS